MAKDKIPADNVKAPEGDDISNGEVRGIQIYKTRLALLLAGYKVTNDVVLLVACSWSGYLRQIDI